MVYIITKCSGVQDSKFKPSWGCLGAVDINTHDTVVNLNKGSLRMSVARFRAGGVEEVESNGAPTRAVKPERNLLSAVLARAICDAFGSAQCDRHVVRSARQWLFGKLTPTRAFSFAWVAQHLDLDPIALQQTLKGYEHDPDMLEERLSMLR